MPRMDGWEAMRLLKADAATKDIPLVMLTAHAFDEHRERAKEAARNRSSRSRSCPIEL